MEFCSITISHSSTPYDTLDEMFKLNVQIKTINYYTHIITLPTAPKQAFLLPDPAYYLINSCKNSHSNDPEFKPTFYNENNCDWSPYSPTNVKLTFLMNHRSSGERMRKSGKLREPTEASPWGRNTAESWKAGDSRHFWKQGCIRN